MIPLRVRYTSGGDRHPQVRTISTVASGFHLKRMNVEQFEFAQHETIQVTDCDDPATLIIRKIDFERLFGA